MQPSAVGQGWPSVYLKQFKGPAKGILLIVVYVDDLLFRGTKEMNGDIAAIRELVKMEDPSPIGKFLGCQHNVTKVKLPSGATETTCEFDMVDSLQAGVQDYKDISGQRLKEVDSPYPPDLPQAQLDEHCASFLMRLLYPARMAAPWLTVAIQRLATQMTKWSAEADRRLHRFSLISPATQTRSLRVCFRMAIFHMFESRPRQMPIWQVICFPVSRPAVGGSSWLAQRAGSCHSHGRAGDRARQQATHKKQRL